MLLTILVTITTLLIAVGSFFELGTGYKIATLAVSVVTLIVAIKKNLEDRHGRK